ncbi:bifunctional 5,10-methylenetetrahydrofolate dehydrogenase/5,10-methenyltetrahydrofolate cyclohydrolase [Mycoplasmopsis pulmonis]|nr:bifunctional 5,10-methylenetetrahydrofolate dehydrogenase/5,10-methenyltetrahydrofolate cyclohydrolase [Mycoplasmopsis pulmonis]MDZ7293217.1 bifunctional 5,10-methylenetetrahydrofolate dehydrogenase/5,10-methenyltetrahydrofolate cyclohydrolase [Mycoplasmopsis pulmonis]
MKKLLSNELVQIKRAELKEKFSKLDQKVKFAIVLIGDNASSKIYVKKKIEFAQDIGVEAKLFHFEENVDFNLLKDAFKKIDKEYDGIILQLPVLHFDVNELLLMIDKNKDLDGLNPENEKAFYENRECIIPATARAIWTFLKFHKISVENKKVFVVGQSRLVGKPISQFLKNNNAIVRVFDKSTGLKGTEEADILIVATGVAQLIKAENIKENSILIDVGFSKINNKIYGDLDIESIKEKALKYTPPIGAIGPVTVLSLFENLYEIILKKK